MIGIFDSGFGGLVILRALTRALPDFGYVYFGDNANAPYGERSQEEIFRLTVAGVEFLFEQGAELVILACNTASATALRRIQQEILPERWPDKRVLGILAPTVEAITGVEWNEAGQRVHVVKTIGIFGTEATVQSDAYVREIEKRTTGITIFQQACPRLSEYIERDMTEQEIDALVKKYVEELVTQAGGKAPETILLGCTHYPLFKHLFEKYLPDSEIYEQAEIVTGRLKEYLRRHPEVAERNQSGPNHYFTSGEVDTVSTMGTRFFGEQIQFKKAAKKEG